MIFTHLIAASLAAKLVTSYLVTPDGTAFPGADSDCSAWVQGTTGISCSGVAAVIGITLTEFETWVTFLPLFVLDSSWRTESDTMARIPWLLMDPPVSLQVDIGTVFKLTLGQPAARRQR
jgi:hypothetical protein